MDSLAKIYDAVIYRRLSLWFTPDREQAGGQRKRGCTEHIVALRMLIDYAKHRRKKLFIVYIDFSKAYDRVPRHLMLDCLTKLGCGSRMIRAIATMYQHTKMILKSAIVTASIGVRQGAPTSCLLFTMVVNDLIRNMKRKCEPDGYLEWLHTLMLMDDTVILATSKEKAIEKIKVLTEFCTDSGLKINEAKTKFMVINGAEAEKQPLKIESPNEEIDNCERCTYLGGIFTQKGDLLSAVKAQCNSKFPHIAKFEAFVRKNADAPYAVKEKVFTAALTAAIMYSCESWLSPAAAECARTMYIQAVRCMLGVRKTTAGELCLIEAGLPTAAARVKASQKSTLSHLVEERRGRDDDPFWFIYQLTVYQSEHALRKVHQVPGRLRPPGELRGNKNEHQKQHKNQVHHVLYNDKPYPRETSHVL
jgi:hypothetical protein